jgi:epoxyqueuosine reductase
MNKQQLSQYIHRKAIEIGFDAIGISQADYLPQEAELLKRWLAENRHGEMKYMENHFEMRTDPRLILENAKSVISVALNYFPKQLQRSDAPQISKYAYGQDYHSIIKKKLFELQDAINQVEPHQSRIFTDSAPVMDKAWAIRAGLGWEGKNGNIINPKLGSFIFLGEIITDLELEYNEREVENRCGTCTKCITACPTQAIYEAGKVDGSRCLSYHTIERKAETIDPTITPLLSNCIYGCDICQDVCPWNQNCQPTKEEAFTPHPDLLTMDTEAWQQLTIEQYQKLFKKSAVKRIKYHGIIRNIKAATASQ